MSETNASSGHQELLKRIVAAGRRWSRRAAGFGLLRVATIAVSALVVYLFLDTVAVFPPAVRVPCALVIAAFVVYGLARWVVRPLLRRPDPAKVAARIEENHPELGELIESAAGLWDKRGKGRHGYSVELIDALVDRAVHESAGVDFGRDAGGVDVRRSAFALAAVLVLSILGIVGTGGRLGPAIDRFVHPFAVALEPPVTITVEPGDTVLVSGDDLAVSATIEGPASSAPVLWYQFEGEAARERVMTVSSEDEFRTDAAASGEAPPETRSDTLSLVEEESPAGANAEEPATPRHVATLPDVRSHVRYSVRAGDDESEHYTARVIERPFVTGIRLDYEFPAYSGLLPRAVDENNGDITALAGTRVALTMTASKPLERADLIFESGASGNMTRLGPRTFVGDVVVRESTTYAIHVLDADELANADPPVYSIVSVRDEYPMVRIVEPGRDTEVPRGMELPLVVSALDDYGVSELRIRYAIEGHAEEGVLTIAKPKGRGERELMSEVTWDLSETGILPGSVLVYFAEVLDTDRVSGPKLARSESYLIRFPSMAELYSEVTGEQDDMITDLDDLLGEQDELQERFDEIQEDIRSDPSIDWQEEEEVEAAIERQEDLVEDVAQMADRMSELSEKMSESDRVSLETLEKIDELTKLLDEVATEEMRELLERIRDAMEQIAPEDVSQAMEELSITQDDYLRRLEQTLNLLRRAKAEQQLEDLTDRAEDLANRQERLAEEARQSPGGEQCQKMSEEQAKLQEEYEKLKADLEKAIEDMSKVDKETADQMRQAASEMQACDVANKMNKAREKLEQEQSSEAAAMCQSAANDLLTLFTRLGSSCSGMACKVQNRDREATLRAIDELLGVSTEQEEIVQAVTDRSRIPREEIVELVAKEADLAGAMSSIAERMFMVSKDSFVIDPTVYRAFGLVEMFMTRAAASIAEGGTAAGHGEARDALGRINALIVNLLTANQSKSASSSGSAMDQLMQQLQQMAEQQSELSDATEQLRRQIEQLGMSPQLQRQLAEMKGQQQRILDEARRLAQEFGDRREILGRLDDTVEEIEKTLAEMERSGASQETIDRQKRILSRLLDAQRSLRRRDYNRERRSRTGEAYVRTRPGELPEDLTRANQELREDLLRAMQRDYPAEYRELIRAYFEGLSEDLVPGAAGGGAAGDIPGGVPGSIRGDAGEVSP